MNKLKSKMSKLLSGMLSALLVCSMVSVNAPLKTFAYSGGSDFTLYAGKEYSHAELPSSFYSSTSDTDKIIRFSELPDHLKVELTCTLVEGNSNTALNGLYQCHMKFSGTPQGSDVGKNYAFGCKFDKGSVGTDGYDPEVWNWTGSFHIFSNADFTGTTLNNAEVDKEYNEKIPVQGFGHYECKVVHEDGTEDENLDIPGLELKKNCKGFNYEGKYEGDSPIPSITGTPTQTGNYTIKLKVSCPAQYEFSYIGKVPDPVTQEFTLTVAKAPKITTELLPAAVLNEEYTPTVELTVEEGCFPTNLTWQVIKGALPNGLSITSTEEGKTVISGTPKDVLGTFTVGNYNFTIQAKNGANLTDEKAFTLTVNKKAFIMTGLLSIHKNKTYTKDDNIKIETEPAFPEEITFTAENLPDGLTLTEDGYITGQVADSVNAGRHRVQIKAHNGAGENTGNIKMDITAAPEITTQASSYKGVMGKGQFWDDEDDRIATGIQFTDDEKGYPNVAHWSAENLPKGLSINPDTGLISGAPQQSGPFKVTVKVDNGKGDFNEKVIDIDVAHNNSEFIEKILGEFKEEYKDKVYTYRTNLEKRADLNIIDFEGLIKNKSGESEIALKVEEPDESHAVLSSINKSLAENAEHVKIYDISFVNQFGKRIDTSNLSGNINVYIPYDDEIAEGWSTNNPIVYHINEETGECTPHLTELVAFTLNGKEIKNLKFVTNHFSKFAIVDPKQVSGTNPGNNDSQLGGDGSGIAGSQNDGTSNNDSISSSDGASSTASNKKFAQTGDLSTGLIYGLSLVMITIAGVWVFILKKKKV